MKISMILVTLLGALMALVTGPTPTEAGVGYYYKPYGYYKPIYKKVVYYPAGYYYRPRYYRRGYYW